MFAPYSEDLARQLQRHYGLPESTLQAWRRHGIPEYYLESGTDSTNRPPEPRISRGATERLLTELTALHLKAERLPVPAQRLRDARRRPQYAFSRTEADELRQAVREVKTLARRFLRSPDTPALRRLLNDERLTASRWASRTLLEQLRRNEALEPEYLEQAVDQVRAVRANVKG